MQVFLDYDQSFKVGDSASAELHPASELSSCLCIQRKMCVFMASPLTRF